MFQSHYEFHRVFSSIFNKDLILSANSVKRCDKLTPLHRRRRAGRSVHTATFHPQHAAAAVQLFATSLFIRIHSAMLPHRVVRVHSSHPKQIDMIYDNDSQIQQYIVLRNSGADLNSPSQTNGIHSIVGYGMAICLLRSFILFILFNVHGKSSSRSSRIIIITKQQPPLPAGCSLSLYPLCHSRTRAMFSFLAVYGLQRDR